MAEYIEREALIKYLKEKQESLESIGCENMAKDIGRIIKHIDKDKIPTADVVEVRRGEWIRDEWSIFYPRYNCSVCGCGCTHIGELTKFCPNCGADMRGNKNDNRTEN